MRDTKGFTLIDLRISLLVPGLIIGLLAPTMSLADTGITAEITKVEDFMRQASGAYAKWFAKDPKNAKLDAGELEKAEYLKSVYHPPSTVTSNPNFSDESPDRSAGGCGKNNTGQKIAAVLELNNVTEEFCKAYNEAHGLGATIAPNCSQTNCPSGSTSAGAPAPSTSVTYCYNEEDSFSVHYNTGVKSLTCP